MHKSYPQSPAMTCTSSSTLWATRTAQRSACSQHSPHRSSSLGKVLWAAAAASTSLSSQPTQSPPHRNSRHFSRRNFFMCAPHSSSAVMRQHTPTSYLIHHPQFPAQMQDSPWTPLFLAVSTRFIKLTLRYGPCGCRFWLTSQTAYAFCILFHFILRPLHLPCDASHRSGAVAAGGA